MLVLESNQLFVGKLSAPDEESSPDIQASR